MGSGRGVVGSYGFNSGKYGFLCYSPRGSVSKHKKLPHYQYWTNMLIRCYDPKHLERYPTYADCSVYEDWRDYQEFALWLDERLRPEMAGWHLDKDLLIPGNKVYCPEACVLIPKELNLLLGNKSRENGLPVGVTTSKQHSKYMATINEFGKPRYLGIFNTPEEAGACYRSHKEKYIRVVAEQWKSLIDDRLYTALMNYQIN